MFETNKVTEVKYDKKIKFNGFEVNARKWKAKEKFSFKNSIKEGTNDIIESLVYKCLDNNVVLSPNEYKYALAQIRAHSLGEEIELEFFCDSCNERFRTKVNLNEIVKPVYKEIKEIKTKNHNILLGTIKNPDFYKKVIVQAPNELDFYLRIHSINDEECFSIEEVIKYFNEMDIDEFEEIINQWEEIKFKIDDIFEVKCTKCGEGKKYQFDEIPGFFPNSWYE